MKTLLLLAVLLVGCEPPPPDARMCDYCRRPTARFAYKCEKCTSYHWACRAEHTMIDIRWSVNHIHSCPKPEDAKP